MDKKSIGQKILHFPITKIIIGLLFCGVIVSLGQLLVGKLLDLTALDKDIKNLVTDLVVGILAIVSYTYLFKFYEKREIKEFSKILLNLMKVLLLLLFPFVSVGQVLTGIVVNKETKQRISFATVGLVKQNIGTNADEEGRFKLDTYPSQLDTFIISSVGYETLKVPVDKVSSSIHFELKPKETILKEVVVVSNYNWRSTTLGQYSNCGSHYYTTSNTINQVAQYFKAPEADTYLSEIEICKYGIAIIDPARTKFRVRIYSMDRLTKQPSKDLYDRIIELDVTGRRIKINLEKYNIIIPDKDFFVAVEWLRIPLNEEKNKGKFGGQKKVYSTYSPLLAIKEDVNSEMENWQLDYTGKWRHFRWTLMISATVKY